MDSATAISRLKAHEAELRGLGIASLSIFGSTARNEARLDSDVDLLASFDRSRRIGALAFVNIEQRLGDLLGVPVDLVGDPVSQPRLRDRIERDRLHVF